MRIEAVKGQPLVSGTQVYSGSIPISVLRQFASIPVRDSLRKQGYQRKPQDTRINKFAGELRKSAVDVPTSILMNARGTPKITPVSSGSRFVNIELSRDLAFDGRLFIVDGQHRYLAFAKVYDEEPEKWASHLIQFVLMIGASEWEEMNQFYIVNTTAKSVRTDLALDLLKQRAENDSTIMSSLIGEGQEWKVKGQGICERLNKESEIWGDRIRFANQEKGKTIITSSGMVSSLKSVMNSSPFFKKLEPEKSYKIIDAYWRGIRKSLRAPFDDPNKHALQKGIGVNAMHDILPTIIEIVRSSGGSVYDEDAYCEVVSPVLEDLSGENMEGEVVSGAAFWLTAPLGGAAGSYSSSAGRRVLAAKLLTALPVIDVE